MADIAPLTPLRFDERKLELGLRSVVAPPYDVIDASQRADLAARSPHNVVRLILPEGEGDAKYAHAARTLEAWRDEKVLVRDDEPAFYRYDQTFAAPGGDGTKITRRGFLALVKLVPFSAGIVLPHERTLSGPKEDRLKLFRATQTNLSPGFMLYKDPRGELSAPLEEAARLSEFLTDDGILHSLAKITDKDAIRAITEGVGRSSLLIADGHHRYETALFYANETSGKHPQAPAHAEHRYFMTFLANGDDPKLVVFPTHRLIHSIAVPAFEELSKKLAPYFNVSPLANGADAKTITAALEAARKGGPSFALALPDGKTAILTLRQDVDVSAHATLGQRPAVLRTTDVAVLHSAVLEHVLGITLEAQAAKTNIRYPQDARAALAEVRSGAGGEGKATALFLMNATPVADVRRVAEAGEVMPQKATFFFPKVLTGLAIHTLDPARSVAELR